MRWFVIVMAVVLAGCGASQPTPSASPTPAAAVPAALLPGEDWVLVGGQPTPEAVSFGATLQFGEGQVSGQAPVNRYSGPVTIADASMQIGPLASTKMAGPQPAMAAEQAYLAALGEVTAWEVTEQSLTLSDAAGTPLLVYADPASPAAFAIGLIGLSTKEAKARIAEQGYEARVISVDGDVRPVTMDYIPNRINLTIVDGSVTMASAG